MSVPAGKPTREQKKADTRERLLRAAAEAFAQRGFTATSVDELAARAGLTKGAVYAHFADKDALFLALLEWSVGRRLGALQSALTGGAGAPAQAGGAAAWLSGFLDEDPAWSLLFFEFWLHAARDPALRERYAAYRHTARDSLARLLAEQAAALGVELPAPAPALAAAVLALASGVALERLVEPGAVPEELLAAALTRLLQPPPVPAAPRRRDRPRPLEENDHDHRPDRSAP